MSVLAVATALSRRRTASRKDPTRRAPAAREGLAPACPASRRRVPCDMLLRSTAARTRAAPEGRRPSRPRREGRRPARELDDAPCLSCCVSKK